jgi:hypothetical protein
VGCAALVLVGATSALGAADTPKVIPGATYTAEGTELVVDASGTRVRVLALPVHAACKGAAPESQGDDGAAGLGLFTIDADGRFTNVDAGSVPVATQPLIRGRFAGRTVHGTVVVPAFTEQGVDCKRVTGTWRATRVLGTGDTTRAGARYARDDFSNWSSGFEVYNEAVSYAEYLTDGGFRIGVRQPSATASLRAEPVSATVDATVTTGYTTGSGGDGAGLACLGTGPTTYVAGYVSLDGTAHLLRYVEGQEVERAPDAPLPAGLLKPGDQARNEVRLVCTTSSGNPDRTDVALSLNGTEVASAQASAGGAGQVGLFANSATGGTEFTFSEFSVRKPNR